MLVNFGVRADQPAVELCVSEESVHIDPNPGQKREMMVEGVALSAPLTLREAFADLPSIEAPPARAFGENRQNWAAKTTLALYPSAPGARAVPRTEEMGILPHSSSLACVPNFAAALKAALLYSAPCPNVAQKNPGSW